MSKLVYPRGDHVKLDTNCIPVPFSVTVGVVNGPDSSQYGNYGMLVQ